MRMHDKKSIAIVLTVMMLFTLLPMNAFAEDTHSVEGVRIEDDTWYVSTTAGLLAWNSAANTALATSGSSLNLVLEENLDIAGETWTPVGNSDKPYAGTIDGKEHTITGLTITSAETESIGFVGELEKSGSVRNLNLSGIKIQLEMDSDVYVGGIVGYLWDDTSITNCSVNGEMTISVDERSVVYAGGIAGCASGNIVSDCASATAIHITGGCQVFTGGIAGENSGIITACENTGNITANTQSGMGTYAYVGGVAGYDDGQISNCTSSGILTANGAENCYTGNIKAYPNVYVCGKLLSIGEYIDTTGDISTTKPNGGYMYYDSDGLIMHNFNYEGDGYTYVNPFEPENTFIGIIYADDDLTVKLSGDNSLTYKSQTGANEGTCPSEGIVAMDDLLILGDSSKESGTLSITADYGIDGYSDITIKDIKQLNIEATCDGIYAEYDMELIDSNIMIDAGWNGLRSYSRYGGIFIDNTGMHSMEQGPILDIYGEVRAISANGTLTIDCNLVLENSEDMVGAVTEFYEDGEWTYQTVSDMEGKAVRQVVIEPSALILTEDVYVGGQPLPMGAYMDNNGTISTVRPEDGYAYYDGYYLVLKDFVYEGNGFVYDTYSYENVDEAGNPVIMTQSYAAAVYLNNIENVLLAGENTLYCTYDAAEDGNLNTSCDSVGIASDHEVVFSDSIFLDSGVAVLNIEADCGIDCGRDVVLMGGSLHITANKFDGIYANNDVYLFADGVNIHAAQDGIYAYGAIDGDVYIESNGAVHITAGEGYEAIFAYNLLELDDTLMITTPKAGKVSSIEREYMNREGSYIYQTVTDANGNPARVVVIETQTITEDDNGENWDPPSYGYSGDYTMPETNAEVITSDANVSIQTQQISTAIMNNVKDFAAESNTLSVIGGMDCAVQIVAKTDGNALENFAQPVTVTVPISKGDIKNVKDTGNLTLALVTEDNNGDIQLTYVGGKYDAESGTFSAYTAEPGNYVLVEKDDLIKIELTINQTVANVNDKPVENDAQSRIVNNRTIVPVRFVLQHMDCDVEWLHDTRTVVITLPSGILLNLPVDEEIPGFGVSPIIENGRAMVPIAYIAHAMDAYVLWVADAQKVVIVK